MPIAGYLPSGAQIGFYRTAAGSAIDLVVEFGTRTLGSEIKFQMPR